MKTLIGSWKCNKLCHWVFRSMSVRCEIWSVRLLTKWHRAGRHAPVGRSHYVTLKLTCYTPAKRRTLTSDQCTAVSIRRCPSWHGTGSVRPYMASTRLLSVQKCRRSFGPSAPHCYAARCGTASGAIRSARISSGPRSQTLPSTRMAGHSSRHCHVYQLARPACSEHSHQHQSDRSHWSSHQVPSSSHDSLVARSTQSILLSIDLVYTNSALFLSFKHSFSFTVLFWNMHTKWPT